jgi:imidazolonepropionase
MRCDRVWLNARLATLNPALPGLGEVEDGVVACADGRILYAGPANAAPASRRMKPSIAKAAGSRPV